MSFEQVESCHLPGVTVAQEKISFSNNRCLGQLAEPADRFLAQVADDVGQGRDAREIAFAGFKDHAVLVALDGGQNVFVQQAVRRWRGV